MTNTTERVPRKKGEKTRSKILAAARKLFMEQGYDHVGIRSIANEAGVNIALINRYFHSKKELFSGVLEEFGAQFSSPEDIPNLQNQWQNIMAALLDGGTTKDMMISEFRLILSSALSPEVSDIVKKYLKIKRDHMATLLHLKNAKGVASLIFSVSMGAALIFSLLELDDDIDEVKKQMKLIMEIIFDTKN